MSNYFELQWKTDKSENKYKQDFDSYSIARREMSNMIRLSKGKGLVCVNMFEVTKDKFSTRHKLTHYWVFTIDSEQAIDVFNL